MTIAEAKAATTQKFERKREKIVRAAAELINDVGVRGLTFAEVAKRVGLSTTSVTYYFKRKELLAETAFDHSLNAIERFVLTAAEESSPEARVSKFLELELTRWASVRAHEQPRRAQLSEVRAMDDPVRKRLGQRYVDVVRTIRHFFGPDSSPEGKALNLARAHILIENIFWMPVWLAEYSNWDFDRTHGRMMEIFEGGLLGRDGGWVPHALPAEEPAGDPDLPGAESFLRAATLLISQRGYRGASVERIASQIDVSKGSFYYHLETKDDLVMMCFERSYHRVSEIQRQAMGLDADGKDRFGSAFCRLLAIQLFDEAPLLRTPALQALPSTMRDQAIARSQRITRRFANMLIDGIADGSIRPIDPIIASQMIMVSINSAFELRRWASEFPSSAVNLYSNLLANGLFDKKAGSRDL